MCVHNSTLLAAACFSMTLYGNLYGDIIVRIHILVYNITSFIIHYIPNAESRDPIEDKRAYVRLGQTTFFGSLP